MIITARSAESITRCDRSGGARESERVNERLAPKHTTLQQSRPASGRRTDGLATCAVASGYMTTLRTNTSIPRPLIPLPSFIIILIILTIDCQAACTSFTAIKSWAISTNRQWHLQGFCKQLQYTVANERELLAVAAPYRRHCRTIIFPILTDDWD